MTIQRSFVLLAAVVLLVCVGCHTPSKAHLTADPSANFTLYQTFAILPPATRSDLDAATARAVVAAAESGARGALIQNGYAETNRESADLVFYLHGKSLAPVPVTQWGYEAALETFGSSSAEVSRTSNNRFFVEAYDNRTRSQVWMDWVVCSCRGVVPSRIENEMHVILEGFPRRAQPKLVSQSPIPSPISNE
jgi:hypothetical protein